MVIEIHEIPSILYAFVHQRLCDARFAEHCLNPPITDAKNRMGSIQFAIRYGIELHSIARPISLCPSRTCWFTIVYNVAQAHYLGC